MRLQGSYCSCSVGAGLGGPRRRAVSHSLWSPSSVEDLPGAWFWASCGGSTKMNESPSVPRGCNKTEALSSGKASKCSTTIAKVSLRYVLESKVGSQESSSFGKRSLLWWQPRGWLEWEGVSRRRGYMYTCGWQVDKCQKSEQYCKVIILHL